MFDANPTLLGLLNSVDGTKWLPAFKDPFFWKTQVLFLPRTTWWALHIVSRHVDSASNPADAPLWSAVTLKSNPSHREPKSASQQAEKVGVESESVLHLNDSKGVLHSFGMAGSLKKTVAPSRTYEKWLVSWQFSPICKYNDHDDFLHQNRDRLKSPPAIAEDRLDHRLDVALCLHLSQGAKVVQIIIQGFGELLQQGLANDQWQNMTNGTFLDLLSCARAFTF